MSITEDRMQQLKYLQRDIYNFCKLMKRKDVKNYINKIDKNKSKKNAIICFINLILDKERADLFKRIVGKKNFSVNFCWKIIKPF